MGVSASSEADILPNVHCLAAATGDCTQQALLCPCSVAHKGRGIWADWAGWAAVTVDQCAGQNKGVGDIGCDLIHAGAVNRSRRGINAADTCSDERDSPEHDVSFPSEAWKRSRVFGVLSLKFAMQSQTCQRCRVDSESSFVPTDSTMRISAVCAALAAMPTLAPACNAAGDACVIPTTCLHLLRRMQPLPHMQSSFAQQPSRCWCQTTVATPTI